MLLLLTDINTKLKAVKKFTAFNAMFKVRICLGKIIAVEEFQKRLARGSKQWFDL